MANHFNSYSCCLIRVQLSKIHKESLLMSTVTLAEAQTHLPELLASLQPREELLIVQNGVPVAKLTRSERTSWPCQPGSAKHIPHWMALDFDAPLEDFQEYMG
jgi:antitoxin (DNA-binding transcriptional repressor) of toxin-antitoxin stability system